MTSNNSWTTPQLTSIQPRSPTLQGGSARQPFVPRRLLFRLPPRHHHHQEAPFCIPTTTVTTRFCCWYPRALGHLTDHQPGAFPRAHILAFCYHNLKCFQLRGQPWRTKSGGIFIILRVDRFFVRLQLRGLNWDLERRKRKL